MLLNLTEFSTEPLHDQISHQIREKILAGELYDGAELLPARALARTQRLSVQTVERAYRELEREGVITFQNGKGIFVAPLTAEQKKKIAGYRLRGRISPLNVIDDFSKQLSSVFDPEKLRQLLNKNIKDYLHITSVYFALFDKKTEKVILLPSEEFPNSVSITADDNFFQAIFRLELPTQFKEINYSGEANNLYDELRSRNVQVVFPLKDTENQLGFIALSEKISGAPFLKEDLDVLTILTNQFVTALTTARFYIEAVEKRRMEKELHTARQIQQNLLPKELPNNEHFQLAAYSKPSCVVDGDFYDYLPIDERRFGLVIADACGKGMPAAMLISQIYAMTKSEVNNGNSIQCVLKNVNNQLVQFTPSEKFATLFYGVFNKVTGVFQYANAGHNYPILVRHDGSIELLKAGGPLLGVFHNAKYKTDVVSLGSGDFICFYTDGVTETMDIMEKEYGEQHLQDTLIRSRSHSAQDIIHEVIEDLNKFQSSDLLQDDRTIMILKSLKNLH